MLEMVFMRPAIGLVGAGKSPLEPSLAVLDLRCSCRPHRTGFGDVPVDKRLSNSEYSESSRYCAAAFAAEIIENHAPCLCVWFDMQTRPTSGEMRRWV